jgi:hypothetical protein
VIGMGVEFVRVGIGGSWGAQRPAFAGRNYIRV